MPVRLTDSGIAKAVREAPEKGRHDMADAGCPGLRLRVTPSGSTSWALACRDRHGRMRRFSIGAYPENGISEARAAARTLREKVQQGGADPTAERRRDRAIGAAAKAGEGTLKALFDLYEQGPAKRLKTWSAGRKRIEGMFPLLLNRPLAVITLADLQMAVDGHNSEASASFVARSVRPVLRWAAAPGRKYVGDALVQLRPPAAPKRRTRVLTRDELVTVLPALKASPRPYAAALRFMLLTLTRREEVASARWRDVDLNAGTLLLPETKNGEPHVIPLSRQALALLQMRVPVDSKGKPIKPKPGDRVFVTSTGAALGNWDRETKVIQEASNTSGWTRHDLRRTGATMLGDMGELPDIIEAALNHVSIRSPLAASYNRSRYRLQVATALQRLADALHGIETGGAVIVPLRV